PHARGKVVPRPPGARGVGAIQRLQRDEHQHGPDIETAVRPQLRTTADNHSAPDCRTGRAVHVLRCPMKRVAAVLCLLLLTGWPSSAQTPRAEISGGYGVMQAQ